MISILFLITVEQWLFMLPYRFCNLVREKQDHYRYLLLFLFSAYINNNNNKKVKKEKQQAEGKSSNQYKLRDR